MRKVVVAVLVVLACAAADAQQFEVASVKPAAPLEPQKLLSGQQRLGVRMDAARVDIEGLPLAEIINTAFRVKSYQVKGPDWLTGNPLSLERYDIHATLPAGASKEQMPEMLQALLADRFKLTAHREQKEQSILALVVGKGGPKLKPSPAEDKPADPAPGDRPGPQVQISGNPQTGMTVRGAGQAGATRIQMSPDGTIHLEAERLTMAQLADSLTRFAGRPVVDMTGLSGPYVVALDLSRDDLMNAARAAGVNIPPGAGAGGAADGGPADPSGTSVLQSVEQLGLKLDSRKAPMDYLVIDHLEKTPTED